MQVSPAIFNGLLFIWSYSVEFQAVSLSLRKCDSCKKGKILEASTIVKDLVCAFCYKFGTASMK